MNVSRETQEKLELYHGLLKKWNPRINLVSPTTLSDAWERHFLDSLQVFSLAPSNLESWADFGSGGGFPGAVVGIALHDKSPSSKVTLVESDQRKATFLRTVSRETKVPMTIVSERVEHIETLKSDVISARALAPLDALLEMTALHLREGGTALFQKGENWREEIATAEKRWHFSWHPHKSVTNPNAVVLEIGELSRA